MRTAGHAEPLLAEPGVAPLFERTTELDALAAAVGEVESGRGAIVMLEAPAGLGKTVVLDHAAGLAADAAFELRRAAPGPLERHFAYGVVRALLEAPLRDLPARERLRLEAGPAADAIRLLRGGDVPQRDAAPQIAHSLFWLCSALAAVRPLALLVDDAQWADRPSLEALSYVARRSEELRLLLVLAARGDDPCAASDLLSLLGRRARRADAASPAADRVGCRRADPPARAQRIAALMPGLPSRGRRQPVAARRAGPPDRPLRAGSGGAWRPSGDDRRARHRAPAPGCAPAPRPCGRRRARRPRQLRAAACRRRARRCPDQRARADPRCAPGGRPARIRRPALRPRPRGRGARRGPHAHRARAPAP